MIRANSIQLTTNPSNHIKNKHTETTATASNHKRIHSPTSTSALRSPKHTTIKPQPKAMGQILSRFWSRPQSPTASDDDALIASLLNDINYYDVRTLSEMNGTRMATFEGIWYHPYDRYMDDCEPCEDPDSN